jgi:hypothetical protein
VDHRCRRQPCVDRGCMALKHVYCGHLSL